MSYLEIIDKNKDSYFYKFADKFFGENAWTSAKSNDDASIAFIVAFYTVIQSRCNANDDVASRIVYNSMKKIPEDFTSVCARKFSGICNEKYFLVRMRENFHIFIGR